MDDSYPAGFISESDDKDDEVDGVPGEEGEEEEPEPGTPILMKKPSAAVFKKKPAAHETRRDRNKTQKFNNLKYDEVLQQKGHGNPPSLC